MATPRDTHTLRSEHSQAFEPMRKNLAASSDPGVQTNLTKRLEFGNDPEDRVQPRKVLDPLERKTGPVLLRPDSLPQDRTPFRQPDQGRQPGDPLQGNLMSDTDRPMTNKPAPPSWSLSLREVFRK